jgi:hypothetical protein
MQLWALNKAKTCNLNNARLNTCSELEKCTVHYLQNDLYSEFRYIPVSKSPAVPLHTLEAQEGEDA